jgi:hypothetical protein
VFQVHGIDASEKVVVRRALRRSQLIGFFEALPPKYWSEWQDLNPLVPNEGRRPELG